MQETRRQILEILRASVKATVDEIVDELRSKRGDEITSVTVRHHLSRLQKDGFICSPQMRHRSSPGRPQHIYELTNHGMSFFPNNFEYITGKLLSHINNSLSAEAINVIIEGVADGMATDAKIPNGTIKQKLIAIVEYLNSKGYSASWENDNDGYLLHTSNCPYHNLAQKDQNLCQLDMRLVASMLGIVPRLKSRIANGADACTYLIPHKIID